MEQAPAKATPAPKKPARPNPVANGCTERKIFGTGRRARVANIEP